MGSLSEHFMPANSGYAIHRVSLGYERLPECCRTGLADCGLSVRHLGTSGDEVLLPLLKCGECGRYYAGSGGRFIPVDNPLKYEITGRR